MNEHNPAQPPRILPCPICGGARLGNFVVSGQYAGLQASRHAYVRPLTALGAVVCMTCGNVELGVRDLNRVREAVAKHPEWFTH